mgnify:CR=1 FL=1
MLYRIQIAGCHAVCTAWISVLRLFTAPGYKQERDPEGRLPYRHTDPAPDGAERAVDERERYHSDHSYGRGAAGCAIKSLSKNGRAESNWIASSLD